MLDYHVQPSYFLENKNYHYLIVKQTKAHRGDVNPSLFKVDILSPALEVLLLLG